MGVPDEKLNFTAIPPEGEFKWESYVTFSFQLHLNLSCVRRQG